jgi:hypothetical protein
MRPYHVTIATVFLAIPAFLHHFCCTPEDRPVTTQSTDAAAAQLEMIRPAEHGARFVGAESSSPGASTTTTTTTDDLSKTTGSNSGPPLSRTSGR